MKDLVNFLNQSKERFVNLNSEENIHLVLGNESCDLDSTICSILYAYLAYTMKKDTLVVPILNVKKDLFILRTVIVFVLQNAGICPKSLVFRDEIDLDSLLSQHNITTTLVDHHILNPNDKILESTVKEIYDHRPVEESIPYDPTKCNIKIEEVGSCCTLIAEQFYKANLNPLTKETAYLLYETIVFDTIKLLAENGRAKELDIEMCKRMKCQFGFEKSVDDIFHELWVAHKDISHLTPGQLLWKDLKVINNIPLPGLPMLVSQYLELEGAKEAISHFAEQNNYPVVVLIGIDGSGEVRRDVAIFFTKDSSKLKDNIVEIFSKDSEFQFSEPVSFSDNIICFKQGNVKLTRKKLVPLIKLVPFNS